MEAIFLKTYAKLTLIALLLLFLPAQANQPTPEHCLKPEVPDHPRLLLLEAPPTAPTVDEAKPPVEKRFYLYAYRYASDANLIAIRMPEIWYFGSETQDRLMRHNGPLMESIVRSALGRAVAESILNRDMDENTVSWAAAPSITQEGFNQRIKPGAVVQFRGSLQGVGGTLRYNIAGFSIASGYHTSTQNIEPVRISRPFSGPWERGEFGVDTNGTFWLNYIGRW